jgi:ATP-binding cassette, subfamily B, bacterial MsbA
MLALASLTLIASALIGLAFPMVVRYLLDAAFVERNREMLDRIAIGLVLLFSVQAVLNYGQTYWLSAVGERVVAGLRGELFSKLLEMPPGFFAERRTGELTSRLTTDIGLLQGVLSHQIAEFSRQALALVGGVVLLTLMQPRLTLTALGVVPLVIGSALYFGRRLRRMTVGVRIRWPKPPPWRKRRSVRSEPSRASCRSRSSRLATASVSQPASGPPWCGPGFAACSSGF